MGTFRCSRLLAGRNLFCTFKVKNAPTSALEGGACSTSTYRPAAPKPGTAFRSVRLTRQDPPCHQMAATHRTRQDIPWPWKENEGSGREKDGETDQRAHVNRASIRSGQNQIRRKRFLNKCPLQEKGLLFGLAWPAATTKIAVPDLLCYEFR